MKEYCYQLHSISGRILEIFYETQEKAEKEAKKAMESGYAKLVMIFKYPNMKTPIFIMRKNEDSI